MLGLDTAPGWVERLIALAKPPASARPAPLPADQPPAPPMPDVAPLPSRLLADAEAKARMHSAIEILADRAGRISQVH